MQIRVPFIDMNREQVIYSLLPGFACQLEPGHYLLHPKVVVAIVPAKAIWNVGYSPLWPLVWYHGFPIMLEIIGTSSVSIGFEMCH